MKITVESTSKFVELNGVPARIWEGTTAAGGKVHCFITRIACELGDGETLEAFDRELQRTRPPSPEVDGAYPLRMIL